MLDKTSNISNLNTSSLKKNSSTKSCQSLLCLTNRCNQDEGNNKQKKLGNQYFQKLSLKKFTQASFLNYSSYDKQYKQDQQVLYKDKSIQENQFRKINLYPNIQQLPKYSMASKNINQKNQFHQTGRIVRSISQKQFQRPQLQTTDRSISQQLQMDFKRIEDLESLRKRLQKQILQLDQNIDKYYYVYNAKLQQLNRIQIKMKQINEDRPLNRVPSNDQLKSFKKKQLVQNGRTLREFQKQTKSESIYQQSNFNGVPTYKMHPQNNFNAINPYFYKKGN